MKAVLVEEFGGPDVLKVKELDLPEPGETQVLIKVSAIGVNPCEVYIRQGGLPGVCSPPYTPGGDVAGVVHKVGGQVTQFKEGDRVYSMGRNNRGAYAEYAVFDQTDVFLLHPELSFVQGAAIGTPYFSAYKALLLYGQAKPGDTVLIHGASGGVGLAACQIARANGLNVLGTAGSKQGMDMILQSGAHKAFNHREHGYIRDIQANVGDHGIDVILENGANKNLGEDLQLLAQRGRIMVIGGVNMQTIDGASTVAVNPSTMLAKEANIRGINVFATSDEEMAQIARGLEAGAAGGWLRPVVSRQYPLAEASKAHLEVIGQQSSSHSGSRGKLVLVV